MSMSASLTIKNNTGSIIKFISIDKVNDDATFSVNPPVNTNIANGASVQIAMGNSSVFFAPKGVGADCKFMCQSNFEAGQVYFSDPAVGSPTFNYGNESVFHYDKTDDGGNAYTVTVSLV